MKLESDIKEGDPVAQFVDLSHRRNDLRRFEMLRQFTGSATRIHRGRARPVRLLPWPSSGPRRLIRAKSSGQRQAGSRVMGRDVVATDGGARARS